MACSEKAKQLTFTWVTWQSLEEIKLAEVEDYSEQSHSDIEVEDESLDEQDFSETEHDSFFPTSSRRHADQDNQITVQYPSTHQYPSHLFSTYLQYPSFTTLLILQC